ncbi:hypothetical protein FXW78_02500 [Rhodococcus opacus]|nr:hypothetical protein [Rhodococcus opacus]
MSRERGGRVDVGVDAVQPQLDLPVAGGVEQRQRRRRAVGGVFVEPPVSDTIRFSNSRSASQSGPGALIEVT